MATASKIEFQKRIALLMTERGYSQREFARIAGVAPGTVAWWLKGSIPQRRILEILSHRLEVSLSWLEHGQGHPRQIELPKGKRLPSREKALKKSEAIRAECLPIIENYKTIASDLRLLSDRFEQKAAQATREMTTRLEKVGREYVVKVHKAHGGRVSILK